ncbi:outer membrane beta-barrel protein [Roseateles sp.]|uniref:outer membrane beta-barrel protein n=1 Tax=Roseateles sp. TaxID=1971397 RepID=UPI0031DFFF29
MKFIAPLSLISMLALAGGSAQAQVYLEGQASLGKAPKTLCDSMASCKTRSLDGRLTLGYGFGNGLGVEAGLAGYGMAKAGNDTTGLKRKVGGGQLGISYRHPLNNELTLDTRAGLTRARMTTESWTDKVKAGDKHIDSTGPYVGVGVSYRLSEGLSLGGMLDLTHLKVDNGHKRFTNLGVTLRKTF